MKLLIDGFRLCLVFLKISTMKSAIHYKCRGGHYPFTSLARLVIPDELVPWTIPFRAYNPPEYTSPSLKGKPYADRELGNIIFS